MGSGKNETSKHSVSLIHAPIHVCVRAPTHRGRGTARGKCPGKETVREWSSCVRLQYSISIVSPCSYFQRSVYVGGVFWGSYGWKSQGDSSPLLCTMNAREVEQTERGIHETQMEECGCCSVHTASPADLGVQDCHSPPPTFGSSSDLCSPLPSYVSPCYWSPCLFHCC